jgi:hypothetical protein
MAYREFQNEKTYAAPEFVPPKTLDVLTHLNDQRFRQEQLKRQKAEQDFEDIKAFHGSTTIPKYDRLIQGEAENVTRNAQQDIMQHGVITPKTKLQMQRLQNLNARGIALKDERARQLAFENEKKASDKYYDPTININRINEGIPSRGLSLEEELNADESNLVDNRANIGHPQDINRTFKHGEQLGDWMQDFKNKTKEVTYTDENGVKQSRLMESPFVNDRGIPDVTNEHVSNYLNSHASVKPYYTHKAIEQLQNEIAENKAHNPNWMAGMSEGDILSGVIDGQIKNPHPNSIGQTRDVNNEVINKPLDLNERIREMARNDIKEHAHVLSKIDTDLSNSNTSRKWGVTNKNIQVAEGFENKNFSSPSIAIVNPKSPTNPYLRLSTASNLRYNLDNGKVVTNKLPREFILNGGIQMVPIKSDGTPVDIQASSPEELEAKIKALPASEFGPGGIVGTKIAMRGQSVNKKQILDMGYVKMAELKGKLSENPNDVQAQQQLTDTQNILQQINADSELSPELIQKYLGVDVVQNELIPIDRDDPNSQQIKGITGMNPYSEKVLNHFKPLQQAIDQRVRQSHAIERPAVKEYWKNNPKELEKTQQKPKVKIPSKGEVVEGYEFLGGDPSQEKNWKKK